MNFVNHTPFPALAFEGIDQHGQGCHAIVLRQTLTWDKQGKVTYAEQQNPLCQVDLFLGAVNASVIRQESDLCHYKPRSDIIVNAVAHAPQGQPAPRFTVRLVMTKPGSDAPLIDKTLAVTGPRQFVCDEEYLERPAAGQEKSWRLTEPEPTRWVPVNDTFAFGGFCRINRGDAKAQAVARQHWLAPGQLASHPDAQLPQDQQPAAHSVFEYNPIGRGYATDWYLDATGLTAVPAPQIEPPDMPVSAALFMDYLSNRLTGQQAASLTAGLGVRPKAHPERRRLLGTLSDDFVNGEAWLPEDFDFAIWNAAPPDQQAGHLEGGEILELTNLCHCNAPGAVIDGQGDTLLRLELPRQECFVLVRLQSGEMFAHPMAIDTVIVEPENLRVSLVWRAVLGKDEDTPIRKAEARMRSFAERDAERAEVERILRLAADATETPSPTPATTPGQGAGLSDDEFDAWAREMLNHG